MVQNTRMSVVNLDPDEVIQRAEEAGLDDAQELLEKTHSDRLSRPEKARIYDVYDEGRLDRQSTMALIGVDSVRVLEENADGTSSLLSGETSRFLID